MSREPIFVDTNLFLRYLTNDVPVQADMVEQLLRRAATGEVVLITNGLVVAEVVWTLESFYRRPPEEVKPIVLAILNTPGLVVSDLDIVIQAIIWHVEKNIDFIDGYSAAWVRQNGLATICTFDKRHFSRIEGLQVLQPGDVGA